nr:Activating transcription factor 7-interacting protein like [Ipomoea batatas]
MQFNRSRNGDDRFYCAAKARRSQSQSLSSRQNHQNQDHTRGAKSDFAVSRSAKSDVRASADEPLKENSVIVAEQVREQTAMRSWKIDGESQPFFVLGDLWETFKEWSAYGAGVPLILNDTDCVIQYYVPYLSGIQIYADPSKSSEKSRRPGEDSDGDSFRDSSSDGSSDSEQDRGCLNYSREQQNHYCPTLENSFRISRLTLRDENTALQEGFSSDEGESACSQRYLRFEYFERSPPHGREPLADKISNLAVRFPELKTLRSCDLLASSWISVAWYPIYRIPMGPTLKPLDACFLSYHRLHTPLTGTFVFCLSIILTSQRDVRST